MTRIENAAFARGEKAENFMDRAGHAIADYVQQTIERVKLPKKITLLAGKGNNGGDAYTAGIELLKRGFSVEALHLYPLDQCNPLCQAKAKAFQSAGGKLHQLRENEAFTFPSEGIVLDGLVGTGFKGPLENHMARVIEKANQSGLPIIAIDIPSGVSGDSGEVSGVAIRAGMTIYLGLPKLGFFLGKGYDHIGYLRQVEFGFKESELENAKEEAILGDVINWPSLLPRISRTQHKYERGYVLAWAGSPEMPGAALLCCMGALRGGAGIVRLFHDEEMTLQLAAAPWEIIKEPLSSLHEILEEAARAGSMLIGPGLGRGGDVARFFCKLLDKIEIPLVIDADGLYILSKNPEQKIPQGSILTPHRGELATLLGHSTFDVEAIHLTQAYVEKKGVTLICKGAPTFVFHPGEKPLVLPVGDPGMATAGAGDVLTGIVAAMLAAKLKPRDAAIAAVCLHGSAGEIAASEKSSRAMIASDILDALPKVFATLQW